MMDNGILRIGLDRYWGKDELSKYPGVRAVATCTTGTTHVDLDYCREHGIDVISIAGHDDLKYITATAELTVGLILALVRKIPVAVTHVHRGLWDRQRFVGRELAGMRVLIVGCGRIGTMVNSILSAFGCHLFIANDSGALRCLVPTMDIVSVHANYDQTPVMGSLHFNEMKYKSYFINTARGELVDETALLNALTTGHLAGAAIDVMANEQTGRNAALLAYARENPDRLIITPHIGGCAVEAQEKAERILEKRIQEWRREHG